MKLLLDTRMLLWAAAEPDYLRKMLVAQARSEGMHLLTADAAILQHRESAYPQ